MCYAHSPVDQLALVLNNTDRCFFTHRLCTLASIFIEDIFSVAELAHKFMVFYIKKTVGVSG